MSLSVVLPIHNSEKTLSRAIESILNQSLPAQEIVCCLNQCTDSSKELLQKYAKENGSIKILEQNLYKGIVSTLNFSIQNLSNDCTLVARMDADDFSYVDRFKLEIDFLNENTDIHIVGGQMRVVKKETFEPTNTITKYPSYDEGIKESLSKAINPIGHPTVLFKREIFLKAGIYSDIYPLCEDMDLWSRCARNGFKFSNLNEVVLDYTESHNPEYSPLSPQLCSHNMRQVDLYFPRK